MTDRQLTWRRVFNTDLRIPQWGEFDIGRAGARAAGYEFFCWNGWIYHVDTESTMETVCLASEVK